jgi:hypothetical protein
MRELIDVKRWQFNNNTLHIESYLIINRPMNKLNILYKQTKTFSPNVGKLCTTHLSNLITGTFLFELKSWQYTIIINKSLIIVGNPCLLLLFHFEETVKILPVFSLTFSYFYRVKAFVKKKKKIYEIYICI